MAFSLVIYLVSYVRCLEFDAWVAENITVLNENITSIGASCGLSIALDTMQPCPHECSRFCGLDQRDNQMWSRRLATGAQLTGSTINEFSKDGADYDSKCYVANPLCVAPSGAYSVFDSSQELSLETGFAVLSDASVTAPWLPYGAPIANVDTDATPQSGLSSAICRSLQYHRSLILSKSEIAHLINPLRLGHMSLRMDNRYLSSKKGLYSEYIRVGYEVPTGGREWLQNYFPRLGTLGDDTIPSMIYDGSIYFNTKVKRAIPSALPVNEGEVDQIGSGGGAVEFKESFENQLSRSELVGRPQLSSTFHALMQQWFLRHRDDETPGRVAVTISRAYPSYSIDMGESDSASRTGEAGVNINSASFDSAAESDAVVKLESMSVLSYVGLSVNPACADRSNCASCTATGACAWCDMSSADVNRELQTWGGWFADAKARHENGSACGIPPQVCAMMGGEPTLQTCPPTWKDEWDQYRD